MNDPEKRGFDHEEFQRAIEELERYWESTRLYRFLLKTVDLLDKLLTRR